MFYVQRRKTQVLRSSKPHRRSKPPQLVEIKAPDVVGGDRLNLIKYCPYATIYEYLRVRPNKC